MVYNLNKNRGRCPSCVVLLWLNYVRMSATYEAVNNTLYKLFTRDPRSPTLERQIKTTVLPKQVDVPKFLGWLWWRICFLFSYLFLILWLWGEAGFSCNQVSFVQVSYMFVNVRTCSYMNDLRPPPPPPFTRLFTSGPFQFPFFNKGKVNGGGGGGWKVIHKLTLSINRPKNLSNNLNSSKRNINFVRWKAPPRLLHVFFQSFSMQMSFFNWHFHWSFLLCWK